MRDWDERYRRGEHEGREPDSLLVRAVVGLAPGRALDLACGAGRHALFLAEHGWEVEAVDRSPVAIDILRGQAAAGGLSVKTRVADLERGEFIIAPRAYDLICVFYYLQRDLFPAIRRGLRPGATFVAAIYMIDSAPGLKPMHPDFLLAPGELREAFAGCEILAYDEARAAATRRLAARLIARAPSAPR